MKPIVLLIAGALLIYIGASGKAEQIYRDLAGKKA
jgi:hypothetical protein